LATSCFTERPGFLPGFPWAERHKAKVCDVLLMLIGDILSPGGSWLYGKTGLPAVGWLLH